MKYLTGLLLLGLGCAFFLQAQPAYSEPDPDGDYFTTEDWLNKKPFFDAKSDTKQGQGWFWYEDPERLTKPQTIDKPQPKTVNSQREKDLAKFEAFKKRIEDQRKIALINPTVENVTLLQDLQTREVMAASHLSDVAQRVVWANPYMDFTQQNPVNPIGMKVKERQYESEKREMIDHLAKTSVLFFFFRSDCSYCHAMSPIVSGLSMATGIKIFPITLDGGSLPEFPSPKMDNGMSKNLGIESTPALFLAIPAEQKIMPVAYGVMNEMGLLDRLFALTSPRMAASNIATPKLPLPEIQP